MTENQCPQCGAPIDPGAIECKFCGEKLAVQQARQQVQQSQPQPQIAYAQMQPSPQQVYASSINPFWPIKSRILAGLLGIFFGGIGKVCNLGVVFCTRFPNWRKIKFFYRAGY